MSKRFTKQTVNWAELQKLVPPQEKGKFLAFKAKADAYLRRVNANPPELPKIDWKKYQSLVPVAGMVEKFQKEYEAVKVPYPEDKLSAAVDEQWKSLEPQIKAYCDERDKDIKEQVTKFKSPEANSFYCMLQSPRMRVNNNAGYTFRATKEMDRIKKMPKFEDMTMETVYDLYPEQALDPVNRPTFWPHDEESQLGYVMKQKATK